MAVSMNNADIITAMGDHHLVAVAGGEIKRIKATDLGIGGGGVGGTGLPPYKPPSFQVLPFHMAESIAPSALAAAGSVRINILPPGDYTGAGIGLYASTTASAVQARVALYEVADATLAGGNLIKDLGTISKVAGEAIGLYPAAQDIGVQENYFLVAVFIGDNSGDFVTASVEQQGLPIPVTVPVRTHSAWRGNASVPYPGAGDVPSTCPAYTLTTASPVSVSTLLVGL